jgi:hypothetical protein
MLTRSSTVKPRGAAIASVAMVTAVVAKLAATAAASASKRNFILSSCSAKAAI